MNLIVETDIGRDPDDFFCLCYLIAAGIDIKAITIFPGDDEQISLIKLISQIAGIDIPIGIPRKKTKKESYYGDFHFSLLEKYKIPKSKPDGIGSDIIKDTISKFSNCDLLCIGPVTNIAEFLNDSDHIFKKATMQGGFLPYYLSSPTIRLNKFENKSYSSSFNFNNDIQSMFTYLFSNQILEKRYVGKNVCHSISYDLSIHKRVIPKCDVSNLFHSAMSIYLSKHSSKKFHDPMAAACHVHPEIGKWFCGKPKYNKDNQWTTVPNKNGDQILYDVDHEIFWDHIVNFK